MDRISRVRKFCLSVELEALRGSCERNQVGCIAVKDNRVIATGYNGAPKGVPHCTHDLKKENDPKYGAYPGCQVAVHAEANLIAFSARHGIALESCDIYCTHSPCLKCAQLIINAGIKKVYYMAEYRIKEGIDLLKYVGIKTKLINLGD